jgi:hypothetical protein
VLFGRTTIDKNIRLLLQHPKDLADFLIKAASDGYLQIVKALISFCEEINPRVFSVAVRSAAKDGHTTILRELLNHQALSDIGRGVAVILAADFGKLEALQLLIADPDKKISEKDRWHAIFLAASHNFKDVVNALLAKGPLLEEDREAVLIKFTYQSSDTRQRVAKFAADNQLEVLTRLLIDSNRRR